MKCQVCNNHEADVILGLNNGIQESNVYICHNCLKKFGFDIQENMMRGILALLDKNIIDKNINCQSCGRTLEEYIQTGRYGCKDCHKYFDTDLNNNNESKINKMDNTLIRAQEQDKINKKNIEEFFSNDKFSSTYKSIFFTKKMLFDAIKEENYEEAARLRDELKHISNEYYK